MAKQEGHVIMHELLAIVARQKGQAETVRTETMQTFEKKQGHFNGSIVTVSPVKALAEGEIDPLAGTTVSEIQTTVRDEIKFVMDMMQKAIDTAHMIDVGNCVAKANVVLDDGTVLLEDMPAASLLQMEHRIGEITQFIKSIKTLDPILGFSPDNEKGFGYYKSRMTRKPKTAKIEDWVIVVPATDKFPAQTQKMTKDVTTHMTETVHYSALITPAMKATLLTRAEELGRAFAKARAMANNHEISTENKIGEKVISFIFKPLDPPESAGSSAK